VSPGKTSLASEFPPICFKFDDGDNLMRRRTQPEEQLHGTLVGFEFASLGEVALGK
jgi:hypothetical protein